MSDYQVRFQKLLRRLFRFDWADLDFGIYRILNCKRAQIDYLIDTRLPEIVTQAVADYEAAARQAAEEDAERLRRQVIENLGPDALDAAGRPTPSAGSGPLIQKYRQALERAQSFVASDAAVERIYIDLLNFFERYYEEGDFVSKQRLGATAAYAVPYDGREVLLHWANADQYYVKTGERFQSYRFSVDSYTVALALRAADTAGPPNQKRYFLLASGQPLDWQPETRTLTIYLEYRPLNAAEQQEYGRSEQQRPQDRINRKTVQAVLDQIPEVDLRDRLAQVAPGQEEPLLERHLARYTYRNTADFFVHKDLGGFLRRELDYFIKTEVLRLDELLGGGEAGLQHHLRRARAFRQAAEAVIDFLAQVEDFQKRLFEKKKFVVRTEYCCTLDRLPEPLWEEVLQNQAQVEEWRALYDLDGLLERDRDRGHLLHNGLDLEFLRRHPTLVVDTRHFPEEFKWRLLAAFDDLDSALDGLLIKSENFHALRLLQEKYAERVRCIYIDPPFNTGSDDFLYRDNYQHSCWMTMMDNRLALARRFLTEDGSLYVQIDYNEKERLRLLLDEHFTYITEIIWRIGWVSGYKSAANRYIRNHDTIYYYGKSSSPLFVKQYIPYPADYVRRDGNKPEGAGYPLEDTWNCSELDPLNSIQIMSFSKEKVGCEALTQKNENLIERMIMTSSIEGDIVLDFFAGSGTTCAVAQKMRRKWLGVEMASYFEDYTLPRLKRVLFGDTYGISEKYRWGGGGFFQYLYLEQYEDTLDNLETSRAGEGQMARLFFGDDYLLRYMLDFETQGSASLLDLKGLLDPFAYRLRVREGEVVRERVVDLVETFNYLLGLRVRRLRAFQDGERPYRAVLGEAQGQKVVVIWRYAADLDADEARLRQDEEFIARTILPALLPGEKPARLLVNGPCTVDGSEPIEPEFKRRMFDERI